MRWCFETLVAAGAARVVMIGADAPHLPDSVIDGAFAALDDADVVLVPSVDGGYCLIGLREPLDVFSGVRMSTPNTLEDTIRRVERRGWSARLLDASFDIDEPEDLAALEEV